MKKSIHIYIREYHVFNKENGIGKICIRALNRNVRRRQRRRRQCNGSIHRYTILSIALSFVTQTLIPIQFGCLQFK